MRVDSTGWRAVSAGSLITSNREVETLARVRGMALLKPLLRPDSELACTGVPIDWQGYKVQAGMGQEGRIGLIAVACSLDCGEVACMQP